ncbi:hypothetical protein PFICI_01027 [Pestalotiopsis fici W106-1]|uniref:Zn(2)-C6 fungal-type domain-containing protein n=1 Tax=Pestalotiopsis fici (strain W106-1 / CGMCC3.15140) TaxID=1229662 RepID=W3XMI1_PESFW|nr:uncharacterized protein PFICI_01027 [Pestalotiopsis fici W106-1]ETS87199.1 hypothetical protein PFICI_01027 [Pestalotiopsis fici W106-1]
MPRKQLERKRRVHTRSRNGCVTCKAKHLRCDEQKPLCGRCLASGGNCGYADRTAQNSQSPQPSEGPITPKLENLELWDECLSFTSVSQQPLLPYPQGASHDHSLLFNIFSRYRSVVDREVDPNSHVFLVERSLSSPALLHGALLLSALRWTWYSGASEDIQKSVAHHKAEAINFVNDRLRNPALVDNDTTTAGIAALAMAESGFGRPDNAHAHLHGLSQVLALRTTTSQGNGALLYNMIVCTTQGLSQMSMQDVCLMQQSIAECSSTLTLFIDPELQRLAEDPSSWNTTLGDMISTPVYHDIIDGIAPRSEAESRARFLQCCLRVVTMLGPNNLDFFTLNWFIEALIDELSMSETAMLRGNFPRQAWLWAALMARVAATSARHQSLSEAQQADEWKNITNRNIRIASQAANLRTWAEAETLLRTWVWQANLFDAGPLKEIWEAAVISSSSSSSSSSTTHFDDGTVSPSFLDKRLFFADNEKKPIIMDDEAFDLCVPTVWT